MTSQYVAKSVIGEKMTSGLVIVFRVAFPTECADLLTAAA